MNPSMHRQTSSSWSRTIHPLVLLFSTLLLITSCGGGGGGGGSTDTTPPTVSSTSPTNGATGVAINTSVTATFSEAMDGATLTATTFTSSTGGSNLTGTVNYSGTTATFTPSANLTTNTTYTATITTGAKDSAGNALTANYVWSFTTSARADTTPPTVSSTNPANSATGVAINTSVTATFSEAMDGATLTTTTFTVGTGGSNVTGAVGYSGTTATFTPSANLSSNTTYTATITTGAKDAAGNALAANYVWSFTTGTTIAAPQNLAATAGNHSAHLTWDAVAGATGYRVYLSPTAVTDTTGLTGISVAAPPYDATGLTNWQPTHARVTAVSGGAEGPLSNEAVATPSAGWVVTTDFTTPSMSYFHADDPGNEIAHFNTSRFIYFTANNPFVTTANTSMLFGIASGNDNIGWGITGGDPASRLLVANNTGKSYRIIGFTRTRIVYLENTLGGGPYSVHTVTLDGADNRTLVSGCTSAGAGPLFRIDKDAGVVIECDQASVYKLFWSDGVAAATQLGNGTLTANDLPVGLSATTPGCAAAGCTSHVYLRSLVTGRLRAQALDTSAPVDFVSGSPTLSTFVGVRNNGRIIVTSQFAGPAYGVESFDLDGGNETIIISPSGNSQPFNFNTSTGTSPDGASFLIQSGNAFGTFMAIGSSGGGTVDLTSGNAFIADAGYILPNDVALLHMSGGGYRTKNRTNGNDIAPSLTNALFTQFLGASDDWICVFDSTNNKMYGFKSTGGASNLMDGNTLAPSPLVLADKLLLWHNGNDGKTYLGHMDYDVHLPAGAGIAPQVVDGTPTNNVVGTTFATDPPRLYWTARRAATDEVMMLDLSTNPPATQATIFAGPGAGTARADGRFVPR